MASSERERRLRHSRYQTLEPKGQRNRDPRHYTKLDSIEDSET
jgi:hypothetical protein